MARMARILLLLLLSVILLVPVGFVISSQLSLDRDYGHARRSAALPLLTSDTIEGLVRIPARGLEFRARVAGLDRVDGPPLLLLHGFPETSIMWEPLIESAPPRCAAARRCWRSGRRRPRAPPRPST